MNLGAQKVKAWRLTQTPRVRQHQMVARFGLSVITWSRIEMGYRAPPLEQAVALEEAGICDAKDWYAPACPDFDPTSRNNSLESWYSDQNAAG